MAFDELLIANEIEKYDFFQLVAFICKLKKVDLDHLLKITPDKEVINFIGDSSLSFATRSITSVRIHNKKFELKVPFLNLIGAHSPLPNYYLDDLLWEDLQQEPRIVALLNLFNHRLLTFLYKVWCKYRYFVCFRANGDDEFSRRMFALVGLGSNTVRNLLKVNQSKILSYTGMLANAGRSPQLLTTLIAHCFELPEVKILSWQYRRVAIAKQQLNKLGMSNCMLGKNFIVGRYMSDYSGKFTLVISNISLKKMQKLLPTGSIYKSLVNFVSFILRDQLAWDLRLVLAPNQVESMKLGVNTDYYLGWTTFLGKPPLQPSTIITIRE